MIVMLLPLVRDFVFCRAKARRAVMAVLHEVKAEKAEKETAGFAQGKLRSFVERIERLEEEKSALGADIREVYSEAKGQGFDSKIMRQVVRLRKMETVDRQEQEALLDIYMNALGMRA
jgi:uncharacterized protein (UPF0335 family)